MLRGVLRRIVARVRGAPGTDDDGTRGTRFIPSRLDASVRFAHGGSSADVERELADIERQARLLDERQRDR